MFQIDDEEKSAKEKVLQEIMGLMDSHTAGKLKDLKKPAAVEISATKLEPVADEEGAEHEAAESPEEELAEHAAGGSESTEEPSDDDKAMIRELYSKWCQ